MTVLAEIAPRLARAHTQRKAEIRADDRLLLRSLSDRVQMERLVAHRELQFVRAMHTGSGWYISERRRKLDQARARLAAVNVVIDQVLERRAAA